MYFQAALGTNPWTFAAPASNGDSFVLDMATTTVALGKVWRAGGLEGVAGIGCAHVACQALRAGMCSG